MQAFQNTRQRLLAGKALTALAGIVLTTAVATSALAAGHRAGVGHSRGMRGGAPMFNSVPSTAPTFNPSYGYTVPQAPETPVSPGSPGSVFGDH